MGKNRRTGGVEALAKVRVALDADICDGHLPPALPDRPAARSLRRHIERICSLFVVAALVVMLVVIGLDIITRRVIFRSEISDELGGYMLVSLRYQPPVCRGQRQLHHVELVQGRCLRAGAGFAGDFRSLSLAFCVLLLCS